MAPPPEQTDRSSSVNEDARRRIDAAVRALRTVCGEEVPATAILAGAGRSSLVGALRARSDVDPSTLAGAIPLGEDAGPWTFGTLQDPTPREVLVLGPLAAPFEIASAFEATLAIRVVRALGVQRLVVTAAGAALGDRHAPGDVVCVSDHVDLSRREPLRAPDGGALPASFGPRFPDMSDAYSRSLRGACVGEGILEVVAASLAGPQMPTPSEYRMLRLLGADAACVGLAETAVVARQCGLELLALVAIVQSTSPERLATDLDAIARAADDASATLTRAAVRAAATAPSTQG
jgi:purine-nucleoside phosphorylase